MPILKLKLTDDQHELLVWASGHERETQEDFAATAILNEARRVITTGRQLRMVHQARELERAVTCLFAPGGGTGEESVSENRKLLTAGDSKPQKTRQSRR